MTAVRITGRLRHIPSKRSKCGCHHSASLGAWPHRLLQQQGVRGVCVAPLFFNRDDDRRGHGAGERAGRRPAWRGIQGVEGGWDRRGEQGGEQGAVAGVFASHSGNKQGCGERWVLCSKPMQALLSWTHIAVVSCS